MAAVSKRDSMEAVTDGLSTKLKATQLDASAKKRPLGLTDLPPSIRNNIYKYALDTELVNVGKPNVSYSHSIKDGLLQFKASRSPFPVETALFYVSKLISKESLRYFYSKNLFVRFEVYTPDARHAKTMIEDSGLLFSTATPSHLEHSAQHAMDLTIVEKNSSQKRATVMFPAQYLPRLINFLDQASRTTASWSPMHSLFISVLKTYDFPVSRLQGDLLELFRLLSNLGAATVDSKNLLPRYAEGLQSSMTAASFTAENWLATVTEMVDLASDARDKNDYELAYQYGQSAIIAITYGFLTRGEQLHSQPEEFLRNVQRLRWRTELGIGITLSLQYQSITNKQDWLNDSKLPVSEKQAAAKALLNAETSTSHALSLATDSPSPNSNPWFKSLPVELIPPNKPTWFTELEQAQTWYVLGTVHAALGEVLFAAGDLERACGMWGDGDKDGKAKAESAFAKAREGIDWMVKPGTGLKLAMKVARDA